jgi:hypothetical protein
MHQFAVDYNTTEGADCPRWGTYENMSYRRHLAFCTQGV